MNINSLNLSDDELACLIEVGEDSCVEFKESLGGSAPERIRQAVCAFANDLSGSGRSGVVIVGLKDNGAPAGLAVTDAMLRAMTDIRSDGNILPPPTLLVEKRRYQESEIAVLTVLPSDSPPVRYKGVIHVRSGPRRGIATAQDERILNERRRHGDHPFDISPVPGTGETDLHRRQFVDEYLPKAVDRKLLQANERSFGERLTAAKMTASVDDGRATILGLLVLGIHPRDFVPGAYVQFLRIAGNDLSDPIIDETEISGTVSEIVFRLELQLRAHNRHRVDLVSQEIEQRTELYPNAALQQLVRNAIMHRDYEATNAPVRVTWFNNRIEIQSPGWPFGSVTTENFGRHGLTDYRNPNLAESMKVLGYVQRFGVGIPTARRLLREAGHPEIEFTAEPTHLLATVRAASRQAGASP